MDSARTQKLLTLDGVLSLDALPADETAHFADSAAKRELDKMEARVAVGQMLPLLTEFEYQVVRLTYGDDQLTTDEAAKVLGSSQSTTSRAQRSALARMRESLGIA